MKREYEDEELHTRTLSCFYKQASKQLTSSGGGVVVTAVMICCCPTSVQTH